MKYRISQKGARRLKLGLLHLFLPIVVGCATVPTKTYDEAVSEWKSYKDVAKWMYWHFSYDVRREKEYTERFSHEPVRTPKETFELQSGVCFDAARFAKETLNRIDASYEAEIVFVDRDVVDMFVCSFRKDGKLYIMNYGAGYQRLRGIQGPYNSLEEYKKFLDLNDPPGLHVLSVTFGWPIYMTPIVK